MPCAGELIGSILSWSKNGSVPVSPTLPPKTHRTASHEPSDGLAALLDGAPILVAKKRQNGLLRG
ncbi:hypothetical protein GCM10010404_15570 [Nonomuraea africana]